MNEAVTAGVSSLRGGLATSLLVFRILFWSWVIIIFFLASIIHGIEARDAGITLNELGNRFLLISQNLNQASLEIINNGFIYKGIWSSLYNLSNFLSYFVVIYLWLRLLVFLVKRGPGGNTSTPFRNWMIAFGIYALIQVFATLVSAGINGEIHSYVSGTGSAWYYISLPVVCFINFFHAVYVILKPMVLYFSK
jgi:hypothetical protein